MHESLSGVYMCREREKEGERWFGHLGFLARPRPDSGVLIETVLLICQTYMLHFSHRFALSNVILPHQSPCKLVFPKIKTVFQKTSQFFSNRASNFSGTEPVFPKGSLFLKNWGQFFLKSGHLSRRWRRCLVVGTFLEIGGKFYQNGSLSVYRTAYLSEIS